MSNTVFFYSFFIFFPLAFQFTRLFVNAALKFLVPVLQTKTFNLYIVWHLYLWVLSWFIQNH